jgi:hypothetical protein
MHERRIREQVCVRTSDWDVLRGVRPNQDDEMALRRQSVVQ